MEFAIVADDLTGAADCAAAFAGAGLRPIVLLDAQTDPREHELAFDVIARSSDSRDLEPAAAARATAEAVSLLAAHQPRHWFKKIDSTLRGHLGSELRVVIDRVAAEVTVVTPAFPGAGRTLSEGRAYVHGEPLELTALWRGPDLADIAHLPTILAADAIPAIAIGSGQLSSGEFAGRLGAARGGETFVVDAATDAELDALAAVGFECGRNILWVGSAGLAAALASVAWTSAGDGRSSSNRARSSAQGVLAPNPPAMRHNTGGPVLVAVGSVAAQSRRQLGHLQESHGATVEFLAPADLLAADQATTRAAIAKLGEALEAGRDAAVAIQGTPGELRNPRLGGELADRLGELVLELLPRFSGLVLTGGDTARAILTTAGVRGLHVLGNVEAGMPASRAMPGDLNVVTKAGAFGGDDALVLAVDFLRDTNHSPQATYVQGETR